MQVANRGVWYALAAYVLWGLLPVYWKALQAVPARQILAHRILWSFVFLALLVRARGAWSPLAAAARSRRTMLVYAGAAVVLGVNWLTYIWAVNAGQIVDTSLGYYINPLFTVGLGVVVLRERLRPLQWVAVALAALSVVYLTMAHGSLPWVALVLAGSFGIYGLVKELAPLGALPGLTLETALLVPLALVYLGVLELGGHSAFGHGRPVTSVLLGMAGVVTALPLLLFATAARQASLATMGILQYVSPTCGLLLGVAVYHEPFARARQWAFGIIWLALALYWVEGVRHRRRQAAGDSRGRG
jgi:chloramphenicol-sensitive protein RarD